MIPLLFTVAVGPDRPRGEVSARLSLRAIEGQPPLLRLCERFAVRPTWLLTWPVASRPEGAWFGEQWRRGAGEVGVCFEPWNTPPFEANEDRLVPHPPSAIPASAVQAKLGALTAAVTERLGRAPRVHRAAGGGLSGPVLQALERLGYLADVSVQPLSDGRAEGGVDWRDAPTVPYFPDRQRPDRRGGSPVLAVPVSAGFDRPIPTSVARAMVRMPMMARLAEKVAGGPLPSPVALPRRAVLDPTLTALDAMQRLAEAEVARAAPCLHMTLRAEALVPGCSGTCPAPADVQAALDRIDGFLRFAVDALRAEPMTVSGFVERHLRLGAREGAA